MRKVTGIPSMKFSLISLERISLILKVIYRVLCLENEIDANHKL